MRWSEGGQVRMGCAVLWAVGILVALSLPTEQASIQLERRAEVQVGVAAIALHGLLFGIQALLLLWALVPAAGKRDYSFYPEMLALFATASFGALTEVYQGFLPHRSAQLKDVLFDALGAAVGVALLGLLRRIRLG